MTPVYFDEHMLVLNKPSGLLSVPGRGPEKQDCLSKRVQAIYPDALVVHRLDQDTSGLLIMARGIEAQRRISKAFETRQIHKRYMAVVVGKPEPTEKDADGWALIEGAILLDWPNRPLHIIHPDGKPSQGLHILIAQRKVRPEYASPTPSVEQSVEIRHKQIVKLEALVEMKLNSYRDKDKTHLRDMIQIGLIDTNWTSRFPAQLAQRLQAILDDPDG